MAAGHSWAAGQLIPFNLCVMNVDQTCQLRGCHTILHLHANEHLVPQCLRAEPFAVRLKLLRHRLEQVAPQHSMQGSCHAGLLLHACMVFNRQDDRVGAGVEAVLRDSPHRIREQHSACEGAAVCANGCPVWAIVHVKLNHLAAHAQATLNGGSSCIACELVSFKIAVVATAGLLCDERCMFRTAGMHKNLPPRPLKLQR
ncbi:hypothetical protein COO60DRAFT_1530351 [Scenedesmus sp. NREL 46B-D3]|nr:hypothetical protein COO60DRAFT_1530351 [Scenedesmus sp. NREL 46B-D3]